MKKKICSMLLIMVISLSVVGCDGNSKKGDNEKTTNVDNSIIEETLSSMENDLENKTEKTEETEGIDLFEGVDTVIGGDYSSDINYMGTLRDSTNEISFVLSDSGVSEHIVFTYNFVNAPAFNPVPESESGRYFFMSQIEFEDDNNELYISKDLYGVQEFIVEMRSNLFLPNMTESATIKFERQYILKEEYFESLESFKDHFSDEEGIDNAWQYKDFYIIPRVYQDNKRCEYEAYTLTDFSQTVAKVTINIGVGEIQKDDIESILSNLTVEYISSDEEFDSNKCYYEDAIASVVAKEFDIYLKNPSDIVSTDSKEIIVCVMQDNDADHRYLCKLEVDEFTNLGKKYTSLGKYKKYLVRINQDKQHSLIYFTGEYNSKDKPVYIGIEFSDEARGKDIPLELIRENFLD